MFTEAMHGTDDVKCKLFCPPALPGIGKKTAKFEVSSSSPVCPSDSNAPHSTQYTLQTEAHIATAQLQF
jgi:hypothetical protein